EVAGAAVTPRRDRSALLQAVLMLPVTVLVFVVLVTIPVDLMHANLVLVDRDTAIGAAADPGAHGRRVTTGTDHRSRRHLRDKDAVALGVRRHRVRVLRLRDFLDEEIRIRIDHAKRGTAGRSWTACRFSAGPAGAQV